MWFCIIDNLQVVDRTCTDLLNVRTGYRQNYTKDIIKIFEDDICKYVLPKDTKYHQQVNIFQTKPSGLDEV